MHGTDPQGEGSDERTSPTPPASRRRGKSGLSAKRDQYHHGDLRTALLEAVSELAGQFGIEAVTLRGCARLAGVSPSSAFRHFEDKRDLMTAFAAQAIQVLCTRLDQALSEADPPASPLHAVGLAYVRYALEHPAYFRAMWREESIQSERPIYREAVAQLQRRLQAGFAGAIEDDDPGAMDQKEWLIWSSVHGLAELLINGPMANEFSTEKKMHQASAVLAELETRLRRER